MSSRDSSHGDHISRPTGYDLAEIQNHQEIDVIAVVDIELEEGREVNRESEVDQDQDQDQNRRIKMIMIIHVRMLLMILILILIMLEEIMN